MSDEKKNVLDKVKDFKINFKSAAHYVFDNFLSKPYTDTLEDLTKGLELDHGSKKYKGIKSLWEMGTSMKHHSRLVHRWYHGGPHTLRIAKAYVPKVVQVLADGSADQELKDFCQKILKTPKLMDLVQLAMLFAVTGRRSEIGYRANQKIFEEYRQESAEQFKKYCVSLGIPQDAHDVIDLFAEALEKMGDPGYKPEGSENEKALKSQLQKIFSLSHNLDLWRMYNAEIHVDQGLQLCSVPEGIRKQKNIELAQFAAPFLNKTGDVCFVSKQISGWGSKADFGLLSNDVEQCIEVIDQTQAALTNGKIDLPPIEELETLEDKKKGSNEVVKEDVGAAGSASQPNPNRFFSLQDKTAAEKVVVISSTGAATVIALTVPVMCIYAIPKFFDSVVGRKFKHADTIESWVVEHAEQLKLAGEVIGAAVFVAFLVAAVAALVDRYVKHQSKAEYGALQQNLGTANDGNESDDGEPDPLAYQKPNKDKTTTLHHQSRFNDRV